MDLPPPVHGLSALLLQLYDLPPSEVKDSRQVQNLRSSDTDKALLLAAIPATSQLSHRPIHLLYVLLTELSGPWPTLDLIRCQCRLSRLLPDGSKHGRNDSLTRIVKATANAVKASYGGFSDFIGCEDTPALRSTTLDNYITHRGLRDFITSFALPVETHGRKNVVGIALPNGPLLAATCMAVMSYYTAAPINPAAGADQFRADILQSGAKVLLVTANDFERLQLEDSWITENNITVLLMDWKRGDSITIRTTDNRQLPRPGAPPTPNRADDIALILFTSGTSGTKKVVPLTTHSIIAGIVFVMDSWGLVSTDICLNMMPLYHVGGLVRNIFAPIFSGGSTVCCPAFDPNMFWDVVHDIRPTWYYASPSMHSVILAEATARPDAVKDSRIRLACNAAGGLLPSLACQLRDTFHCVVLPSYGMTECMPISTPPLDYRLNREGTSGISTGPELTILDWSEETAPVGTIGRICVRGEPVFPGYLKPDGSFDRSPFNENGWFDTGDLGYMDADGYLYITGRSKEVINRGGELISPFEVENAIMSASISSDSPISGRVSQALAFSACHDILQEIVAVVLVTPPKVPRVDLRTLHSALRSSLQQVKWPVLIVYMDDLPKKNNKVLRIKLGQRLGLPNITDSTLYLLRHWEAVCPPPDTALTVSIESAPCAVDFQTVSSSLDIAISADLRHHCRESPVDGSIEAFIAPAKESDRALDKAAISDIRQQLSSSLHNYMVPDQIHIMRTPFERDDRGRVDESRLQSALDQLAEASLEKLAASMEGRVTKAFADVLARSPDDIPLNADFFELGGDSLRAGRLVSVLRSAFNVHLPISLVFNQGTVAAIASHIEKVSHASSNNAVADETVVGCVKTYSSTNPLLMLIQLIPLAVIYPLRRGTQWTVFIVALSYTQQWPTNGSVIGRLLNLTLSIMFSRIVIRCIAPFAGILAKWLIIGRYRPGLYPMWGWYHTRWWMTQKIVSICGKGIFSLNDTTKSIYCRLMGAKIGRNVKFNGASLGEWDLLDIRDGAVLSRCICRPFAVEGNASMLLAPIIVGENCSVGTSSILAAGSTIPPNTCIGPNSSSWELNDADEGNRDLSPGRAAKPHWLLTFLFTMPLGLLGWFLSLLPWAGGLVGMVLNQPLDRNSPLRDILDWFTAAERVGYHYLALVLRCLFSPFVLFAFTVLVKFVLDLFLGKLVAPQTTQTSPLGTIAIWRASLIKTLLPVSKLHEVTGMFGQHYEATSVALRMLGGNIGKRVYWPGTGPSIGDYHLLDVGNDVVFGSRAHLVTTDGLGSAKVTIKDRAMIADRVCLLPGVEIGERTTMGSGALTRRGQSYPDNGTFVGSKGGDAVCLSTGRDASQEKRTIRSRMQHMSSDDTLTGEQRPRMKQPARSQIQHMSSDDTLAETGRSAKKPRYRVTADPFMTSDSDTDTSGSVRSPSTAQDVSPFGRAFYLKLAPYRVMGPFTIFCYSSFLTVFTAFYWNVPSISSIQLVDFLIKRFLPSGISVWYDILALYLMTLVTIAIFTTLQAVLALLLVVAAKWILLGRRSPGNYDWDKSPYCQRWQLFLCIEKLRRHCYRGHGILGLLTGTSWIVLYFRAMGAKIGKDCALFANGRPSLMFTEPDLITLGDRVVVDDASVVAHINTRGKFDLNQLEIGDRCVLRTGSRLLSGATMQPDSCLLEHTLIMGGDVVEAKRTMQGWPADRFSGSRINM